MSTNKSCALYLGVVIAERLCRHLFNNVEVMKNGNPGFDFICNRNKKIDVKSSCTHYNRGKYPHWSFTINHNNIADYFLCVAFDNIEDLVPLYSWLIPGHVLNDHKGTAISPSTLHKWDAWKIDIERVQLCCTELKSIKSEPNT